MNRFKIINGLLIYPKIISYINEYMNNINDNYSDSDFEETFKILKFDKLKLYNFKYKKFKTYENEEEKELERLKKIYIFQPNINPEIKSSLDNEFINKMTKYINSRYICKNCPLYNNKKFIIHSNLNQNETLDVIIINEHFNYNLDDIKLTLNNYELKYVFISLIACELNLNYKLDIRRKIITKCSDIFKLIVSKFSSNIKILIGTQSKNYFNIKESTNNVLLLPTNFKAHLNKLNDFLKKYSNEKIKKNNINKSIFENANLDLNIKDYTLFDIKIINDKVLYILLDLNGNKKYLVEDISFPVYIKFGQYNDCDLFLFENNKLNTVYLTLKQKQQLEFMLEKKMSSI